MRSAVTGAVPSLLSVAGGWAAGGAHSALAGAGRRA